jgi:hypothetical protein
LRGAISARKNRRPRNTLEEFGGVKVELLALVNIGQFRPEQAPQPAY